MTTAITINRSGFIAGSAATLVLAALGFAGSAHARDNVAFSVGIGVPGVQVGVSNAYPVYTQPQVIYTQPQPVYLQPAPVYVQPQPVYVQPRPYYYGQPQVVYVQPGYHHGWNRRHGHGHGHDRDWDRGERGEYGYRQGYAPVYYGR